MRVKILLLFFVFSFLFRTDHSFDQDLGRHLKLGEIILNTGNIPNINLFSYTNPNFPFINTHWLFEILIYLGQQTIGLQALLIIKVIIFIISVWLILRIIPKENHALLLPIGFIFLHVLRERLELRPEIFSFLFTAGTYYVLEKYLRGPTKLIYFLPLAQLLWINTHIYFFVGLILQAIFLTYIGYRKLRFHPKGGNIKIPVIVLTLSVIVSLINPNGIAGFLYPFNVTKNYGYTIVENQTMFLLESINFLDPNFLFVKLSFGIIALSLLTAFIRRKLVIKNLLIAILGVVLALANVRSFPYLVFLALPATLQNFGPIRYPTLAKIMVFIFSVLLILESYFYLNGDYYRYRDDYNIVGLKLMESGRGALDFVIENDLPDPIYNNFDIGSYIIYRGYPKYQVFVDGRPEGYPKEFFLETYIPTQSDYAQFKELKVKWGFKTIIFSHTDQTPWGKTFLQSVTKDHDWKLIFLDDFMMVLVTKEVADEKNLKVVDINKLRESDFKFTNHRSYLNLTVFALHAGSPKAALSFVTSALELFPESPVANSLYASATGQLFNPLYSGSNKFFW